MQNNPAFTAWQAWPDSPVFDSVSLKETLDGGQAFRWNCVDSVYEGRWSDVVVRLKLAPNGQKLLFSCPESQNIQALQIKLNRYFAIQTDFQELSDRLPWRSDPVLQTAITAFPSLRILRQPFDECLFSFLCSSTKQVPQIKVIHENIAQSLGDRLPDGSASLPSWRQIALAGEAPLRAAKLGYRARYIFQCAQIIDAKPGWLQSIEAAPTELARAELLTLPGVGRKIADCVLLFGAGRLDAFPIDTWVEKILSRAYPLENWNLAQLQQFAQIHFGPHAGFAQQYLFAAARGGYLSMD